MLPYLDTSFTGPVDPPEDVLNGRKILARLLDRYRIENIPYCEDWLMIVRHATVIVVKNTSSGLRYETSFIDITTHLIIKANPHGDYVAFI